jgi:ADP-heptose:LPS heptosyltransferase
MMELDRNAEFMSGLTGRRMRASLPRLPKQVALAPELAVDVPYFVVFPGASRSGRRWPPEAFAALVERVAQKYRLMPVLCGSKAEVALCQSIIDRASVPAINRAGETSLLELAAMIRRAKLLISNETSAIHLAAAVGTRAICILGGGHYGRFMPYPESIEGVKPVPISFRMPCYGCSWHCTQLSEPGLPVPCIANVPIGRVWQAVELELAQVDLNRN